MSRTSKTTTPAGLVLGSACPSLLHQLLLLLLLAAPAAVGAAALQQLNVTLADNPTGVGFYLYVPDVLAARPPVLVNPHWCHGDAPAAYAGSAFAPELADAHGFIVIYPDSPNAADKCWDVSSPQTLAHFDEDDDDDDDDGQNQGRGGDSRGIVSMVAWTLERYPQADASRVFVTGVSSGAMMTNVLVGAYPDVFAAGSAFAGVAYGCFAYGLGEDGDGEDVVDYWNSDCADGLVRYTPEEWTAIVRAGYPGYDGWRPKMQVFHGTADETLNYTNFGEEIKQWTGVFGLLGGDESESLLVPAPTRVEHDTPLANWTKMTYGEGGWFEAYSAWNVTHNIPVQEDVVMSFFDLACVTQEGQAEGGGSCFHWGEGGPSI